MIWEGSIPFSGGKFGIVFSSGLTMMSAKGKACLELAVASTGSWLKVFWKPSNGWKTLHNVTLKGS